MRFLADESCDFAVDPQQAPSLVSFPTGQLLQLRRSHVRLRFIAVLVSSLSILSMTQKQRDYKYDAIQPPGVARQTAPVWLRTAFDIIFVY
jgi:hypothetical protein